MTRTRSLAASFLSLSAAAVLALSGAGGAVAAPSSDGDKSAPPVFSAKVDSSGAADYWTADRMRAAVPGDILAAKALDRGNTSGEVSAGKGGATKDKGTKGKPTIAKPASGMNSVGKVFFTLDGEDYVCSGNAVVSANSSTVATAGHCLFGGAELPSRFIFVPGYYNGTSPYGAWTGESYHLPSGWKDSGNMEFDTGFVVVKPVDGAPLLTDAVDESVPDFNLPRGLTYKAYGYPSSKPFDGGKLWSCTGAATLDNNNAQFNSQGIPCDMTGGSSGGPWLTETAAGTVQNSLNSYGYNRSPVMYGPYWGSEIEAAYKAAEAA
jgi:V8-like Glu-specific endopeptidase